MPILQIAGSEVLPHMICCTWENSLPSLQLLPFSEGQSLEEKLAAGSSAAAQGSQQFGEELGERVDRDAYEARNLEKSMDAIGGANGADVNEVYEDM